MNKDQVKGAAKDVVGKVQEKAGKLVGSKEQLRFEATSNTVERIGRNAR